MKKNSYPAARRVMTIALVGALVLAAVACSSDSKSGSAGQEAPGGGAASDGTDAPATDPVQQGPNTGPVIPSAGCRSGASTTPVLKEKQTLTVDGADRWYLLSTPTDQSPTPKPVVVDFHGFIEGADVHARTSMFGEYGQQNGFIVLGPHGTGDLVRWDTNPSYDDNSDLHFVVQMLDTVAAQHCVDLSRVYATGLSMGAFMSSLVACTLSDRFAAVAPVAGIQMPNPCNPTRPVPILTFHGTADPILPFNGGKGNLSSILGGGDPSSTTTTTAPPGNLEGEGYPAAVRTWVAKDGCENKANDEQVSPEVTLRTYPCPPGVAVEFYVVTGGGHTWPGSEFNKSIEKVVGYTTFDINATQLIWQFFQRFRLAEPAQPVAAYPA